MLVAPVLIICNRVQNELSNKGKHVSVTDASNKSVNSCLSEVHVVFFFVFACETFLGSAPALVNVLVDINHQLEDGFENVLSQLLILFEKTGFALDHSDNKLERLMT